MPGWAPNKYSFIIIIHKNQDQICHKCLVLYLQKIDSAPAVAVTKKCVTKKLTISPECKTPSETSTLVMSPRPGSKATVDYSTQGDRDQPAYSPLSGLALEQQLTLNTHNYLLPDGSGRRIYDLAASRRQTFMLGNGHATYQIELENLEAVLKTNMFLMDRLTGQFNAIYGDSYRQMATTPKLLHPW